MKKIRVFFLLGMIVFFLSACTKSGALTGGGAGSSYGSSITGSVSGGLSPVANATVNLMMAGTSTPLASATTATNGSYSLVFTNPGGTNLLYITATGGNAGSGTNANNQFMTIAGTTASFQSTQPINEITTAAVQLTAMNMGVLNDTNGSITIASPKNSAGASNVSAQFYNLMTNGNLNTSNANLASSTQTGLKTMANMFAACIENSSNCTKVFSAAVNSSGTAAVSLLESGYNALINSSNTSSSIYTLAFPLNSSTGFQLTSSAVPGGFTFNNTLAVGNNTYPIGTQGRGIAIDASGDAWIVNFTSTNVTEISPSGTVLGTFAGPSTPLGLAIDAGGNLWIAGSLGAITELNSQGATVANYSSLGGVTTTEGIAVDPSGNLWVTTSVGVLEFNASGTVLAKYSSGFIGTRVAIDAAGNVWLSNTPSNSVSRVSASGLVGSPISVGAAPAGFAIDNSGNVYIACFNASTVVKISSSGAILSTISPPTTNPGGMAIDATGNIWVSGTSLVELNSAGTTLANYSAVSGSSGIAIDQAGNLWTSTLSSSAFRWPGITIGPQFFPYAGPVFPSSSF